ncbi:MAG: FAD-dependent monooxygenase [Myxococcales bacterium]|nr:FAD-dependent monooxygenase [Myxococcales bacterium]
MPTAPEVLIVGAGPVGLSLALDLHRHGLRVRIVDESPEPSIWSKAQVIHARTLEVFARLGVLEPMLAEGKLFRGFRMHDEHGKELAHVALAIHGSHYNYVLSLSQRATELHLIAALAERGIEVERGVRLESLREEGDAVTAELVDASGAREAVRVPWLVGCDGAHSTVRHALGIDFEGFAYEIALIQADVHIDWPTPLPDDEVITYMGEDGPVAAFPLPGERRYRLIAFNPPDAEAELSVELFDELLRRRGPADARVSDPKWMVGFKIHCRLAGAYRRGRVMIAGDAAHIHSPAGGQGMNMGIQDAHNLAWKLALVARGRADAGLLNTYEEERRPLARATLDWTDVATRNLAIVSGLRGRVARGIRKQLVKLLFNFGFVQTRMSQTISMLEVGYPGSSLAAESQVDLWRTHLFAPSDHAAPSLRDRIAFGDAPAPGQRLPDLAWSSAAGEHHLHEALGGLGFHLLLFPGAHAEAGAAELLRALAASITARYGDAVTPHLVHVGDAPPPGWDDAAVLLDPDGVVHEAFGARGECLFLVRPDSHIGFRGQPALEGPLVEYLARIFSAAPPPAEAAS